MRSFLAHSFRIYNTSTLLFLLCRKIHEITKFKITVSGMKFDRKYLVGCDDLNFHATSSGRAKATNEFQCRF